MVKAYLRYASDGAFGVVASNCNGVFDNTGQLFITAVLEGVAVWNARTGVCLFTLVEGSSELNRPPEVKTLTASNREPLLAAGYSDGAVKVWDLEKRQISVAFPGHRRSVTRLAFSRSGGLIASGSQDTTISIWDVLGETGVCKLQGHSHEITGLSFLLDQQFLVSCAKDGHMKLWQLSSQHCCETVLHEKGVIWALACSPKTSQVVIGSIDATLLVYEFVAHENKMPTLEIVARIERKDDTRVRSLRFFQGGAYLACQNGKNTIEIFHVQNKTEAVSRLEERQKEAEKILKELRRKAAKEGGDLSKKLSKKRQRHERILHEMPEDVRLYTSAIVYDAGRKILSIDIRPRGPLEMGITYANNAFEMVSLKTGGVHLDTRQRLEVCQGGHRSAIRSLSLSSDEQFLLSLNEHEAKVWNTETAKCVHTLPSGYGLASLFAPGDSLVVVGTKTGALEVLDLHSTQMITSIKAHEGPVWAMTSLPDHSGFFTAGADGELIAWNWSIDSGGGGGVKGATIVKSGRSMKLKSDILSIKVSVCGKYIALALLDATIQVLYLENFREYLTLYGHKLPVLSIDISTDGQLIASGSADKNIRIWGVDYGDCHKSLFAHGDSVTQVAFVHTTHYVMSVGKDGMVKYWDADKFTLLLELPGHHAEVWCMAVGREGDVVYTGSNDRSVRKWIRTEEPFFLEDEKERRMEVLIDEDITNAENEGGGGGGVPGRQTVSTVTAADAIVEALELTALEAKRPSTDGPNPLLLGLEPAAYVLRTVQNIKTSDLEVALLSLSFSDALQLLTYLTQWLNQSCTQTETLCRMIIHISRLHHRQFMTSIQARAVFQKMREILRPAVAELRDTVGFNLEGLKFISSTIKIEPQSTDM